MDLEAKWTMAGRLADVRELKSKAGAVFAYAVKLETWGATHEATTRDAALAKKAADIGRGNMILLSGTFESYDQQTRLVFTEAKKAA